jgi:hypothetical protein
MALASDIEEDDDRGDVPQSKKVEKPSFVMLPFLVPVPVFRMLEGKAKELGMTVPNLLTKALQEKLERMEKGK